MDPFEELWNFNFPEQAHGGGDEPPGGGGNGGGPHPLNLLLETEMDRLRITGHLSDRFIQKVREEPTLRRKGELLRKELRYFLEKGFVEFTRFTIFGWNEDVELYDQSLIADKIKRIAARIGAMELASSARIYAYNCRGNHRDMNLLNPTYTEMKQNLLQTKQQLLISLWELAGDARNDQGV